MKQSANLLAVVASASCLVNSAAATFLYDVAIAGEFNGGSTHQQFIEPMILTSSSPVTSFVLNTSTGAFVDSLWLGPDEGDQCFYSGSPVIGGPCLAVISSSAGFALFYGMPTFESVGTFTSNDIRRSATITISEIAAVPEPSSMLLFLSALATCAFVRRPPRSVRPKKAANWAWSRYHSHCTLRGLSRIISACLSRFSRPAPVPTTRSDSSMT